MRIVRLDDTTWTAIRFLGPAAELVHADWCAYLPPKLGDEVTLEASEPCDCGVPTLLRTLAAARTVVEAEC